MFAYWCIVAVYAVLVKGEFLGNNCTLESGSQGQCVLFSLCQSAIQNIRKGIRPEHCGFMGNEPIVCCTEENNNAVEVSKSEKNCQQFKQNANIPPAPGIVNGLPAEAGEFPHIVALGFGNQESIQWLCGGSLISEKFILTAAHCLASPDLGPIKWARMGTINLKEPYRGGYPQDFEIVNRLPHPSYRPPSTYNDIALLEINQTIVPTQYVHPACINTELDTPRKTQAIGWGRVGFTGDSSNDLMKVELELYSNEACNKSYSSLSKRALAKGIDGESQICAGGSLDESKDTCQGDSGGPLHVPVALESYTKLYNIIGITSFGKACGIKNVPAVYTRVSYFVPWIENIVWP